MSPGKGGRTRGARPTLQETLHGNERESPGRSAELLAGAALAALVVAAFLLRVLPPWGQVFRDGRVVFLELDPWIHMRQVDNLLAHFPWPSTWDPYRLFPGGQPVESPLLDLLIAGVAWMLGLGAPSARLVDLVGAFTPPVLGALALVPLYGLAREISGRVEALLACALLAGLPGQFLSRSLLGYTDHHVLEVGLALCVLWALVRALGAREASSGDARRADGAREPEAAATGRAAREKPRRADRAAAVAGFFLAAYLAAWTRGAMLVLVLFAWAVLQLVVDAWHGRDPRPAVRVTAISFAVAFVLVVPWVALVPAMAVDLPLLAAGAAGSAGLAALAARDLPRPRRVRLVRLALVLAAGGALLVLAVWFSPAGDEVRSLAGRFAEGPGRQTVGEAQPWLSSEGRTPLRAVWHELSTSAVLGGLGLALLSWRAVRRGSPVLLAVATWSAAMLVATLLQVRFSYYLTPAVALLGAWFFVRFFAAGLPRLVSAVVVLLVALYPNLPRALPAAANPPPGPSAAWLGALDWLRATTPEPFGDPAAYLARWSRPGGESSFSPPPAAWAVMAWWDHGYWITRVGRRIPIANPTQAGAREAATFFTAREEAEAARLMERLGARWVAVDSSVSLIPVPSASYMLGGLHGMVSWTGGDLDRFVPHYVVREGDGRRRLRPFYTPEYYRTLGVRLLVFGGVAVEPRPPFWVAELAAARPPDPPSVAAWSSFASLNDAEAHVAAAPSRRQLLGGDPFVPCVPVAGLERFTRVHRSTSTIGEGPQGAVPEVAVFAFR